MSASQNKSKREVLAEQKYNELYKGAVIPENIRNADIYHISKKVIYGEIYQQCQLTDKDREMIALATLTILGTLTILRTHVYSALNVGLNAIEITEIIYHCTPYIGAPKVLEAINVVFDVFKENKKSQIEKNVITF